MCQHQHSFIQRLLAYPQHEATSCFLCAPGPATTTSSDIERVFVHYARNAGTMQLSIEHGADVHARDQSQSTSLHMAASYSSWMNTETTVRLLIEHGASVNAYNKNHQTPLHQLSSCWDLNADSLRMLPKLMPMWTQKTIPV